MEEMKSLTWSKSQSRQLPGSRSSLCDQFVILVHSDRDRTFIGVIDAGVPGDMDASNVSYKKNRWRDRESTMWSLRTAYASTQYKTYCVRLCATGFPQNADSLQLAPKISRLFLRESDLKTKR